MAKVGKIYPEIGGKNYELPIEYNSELQKFIVIIPDEVWFPKLTDFVNEEHLKRRGNTKYLHGKTEQELKKNMEDYVTAYEAKAKKERRVIMIQFTGDSNRWEWEGRYGNKKKEFLNPKDRKSTFQSDIEIKMEVRIAIERIIGERTEYIDEETKHLITESSRKWNMDTWMVVDYTDERKEFLEKIYNTLADLIDVMKKSFLNEQSFMELVTGKVKLLK